MDEIKNAIRTIPDWPKQGIMFRDITTLLKNPVALRKTIDSLYERYKDDKPQAIVSMESRGFIFGTPLAYLLDVPFVPVRKPGKLPADIEAEEYELEYGTDKIEIHKDAIKQGQEVIIVDDLLATGGTCLAAIRLVEKLGGKVKECAFVVDLPDVGGRKKLEEKGYNAFTLVEFEGD